MCAQRSVFGQQTHDKATYVARREYYFERYPLPDGVVRLDQVSQCEDISDALASQLVTSLQREVEGNFLAEDNIQYTIGDLAEPSPFINGRKDKQGVMIIPEETAFFIPQDGEVVAIEGDTITFRSYYLESDEEKDFNSRGKIVQNPRLVLAKDIKVRISGDKPKLGAVVGSDLLSQEYSGGVDDPVERSIYVYATEERLSELLGELV